jgi:hypothetical protein
MTYRRLFMAPALLLLATAAVAPAAADAHAAGRAVAAPNVAPSSNAVSGTAQALVVALNVLDANGAPLATLDKTANQVLDEAVNASQPWFESASHGQFHGFQGTAAGEITFQPTGAMPPPVCSDAWVAQIASQGKDKLKANLGFDVGAYQAVIYYFGNITPCLDDQTLHQWSGRGGGGANGVYLNGTTDLGTVTHELGHNLGLEHSGSEVCSDPFGRNIPLDITCTHDVYGDGYSAMGNHATDDYSPSQLAQLGWNIGPATTVTPSNFPTQYLLAPQESDDPTAIHALQLIDGPFSLWVEYRVINGGSSAGFNGGLIVRAGQTNTPNEPGAPFLLFMNDPDGEGINEHPHPQMDVGQAWANPIGKAHISLNSINSDRATVTIRWATTMITVPSAVGLPAPDTPNVVTARNLITAKGLTIGAITTKVDPLCINNGKVIGQTPRAGTSVPARTPVDLVIGVATPATHCTPPMTRVPTALFASSSDAVAMITGARLLVGTITTEVDWICDDAGRVIRQTPTAGGTVPVGTKVNLVVADTSSNPNCPVFE